MNNEWRTPPEIVKLAEKIVGALGFDAACTKENCLVPTQQVFYPETDLLSLSWGDFWSPRGSTVWCNPPYSAGMVAKWVAKAIQEFQENKVDTLFLVRLDPTTGWFKALWGAGANLYFLPKRVTFVGADSCYPFPSVFVHLCQTSYGHEVWYAE